MKRSAFWFFDRILGPKTTWILITRRPCVKSGTYLSKVADFLDSSDHIAQKEVTLCPRNNDFFVVIFTTKAGILSEEGE